MADSSIGTAHSKSPEGRPELLIVGAASRDMDPRDTRGWRLGGTVSYAALAAARLGANVHALVGADAQAADADELDVIRAAGASVVIAPLAHGPVFENRQIGGARQQIVRGISDPVPPDALPKDWRDATAVLVGPVAGELGDEWLSVIPEGALVALAWQGMLRHLAIDQPVTPKQLEATPLVRRADVLFVSAEDIVAGGPALDELVHDGQELFVTAGAHGALSIRIAAGGARTVRFLPPLPRRDPVDATGAGDTFLAAYVAARLAAPRLVGTRGEWRLAAIAAATASLNTVAPTLAGVPTLRDVCVAVLKPRS